MICLNHYYGWYTDTGVLDLIGPQLMYDVKVWHDKFQKPILITEYGSDTIAGLHTVRNCYYPLQVKIKFFDKLLKSKRTEIFPSFLESIVHLFGRISSGIHGGIL